METLSHDGRTIAWRSTGGSGPTICYIHGAGGSHRIWAKQFDGVENSPAVVLDLSGHGDSDATSAAMEADTLQTYADDVVAVCEETNATVLCGNSMGGAVALWIALERRGSIELDGIVLADSGAKLGVEPTFLETLTSDFDAAIETLHAPGMLFHDPTEPIKEHSLDGLRAAGQAVTLRDFEVCDAFDVRDRLDKMDLPTLALCGEHDELTPPAFHEYLEAELPNCRLRTIARAAHMPMLERPEAFNEAVRSFLVSL